MNRRSKLNGGLFYLTVVPNGIKASFANLKYCKPIGMRTIVQQQSTPIAAQ